MTQKIENKDNKLKNTDMYTQIEKSGLNYIKSQKNYLILSAIFPIFITIIQILNINFILYLHAHRPKSRPGPLLIDVLTPFIILLVISAFALINFVFLVGWKKKVHLYEKQKKLFKEPSLDEPNNFRDKNQSLTKLFYDIISNMKIVRIVFIILNFSCLYYLIWYLNFFLIRRPLPIQPPPLQIVVEWLNLFSQIGLAIYLVFEWRHFIKWNKKLKELKKFEKEIFNELFQ